MRTIESLESNCVSALPEGISRRAIVKAVARAVGLNSEQLLRECSAVHPDDLPAPESAAVASTNEPSRSLQAMLALAAVVFPLLAGVAYSSRSSSRAEAGRAVVAAAPIPTAAPARSAEVLPAGGFADAGVALPRPIVVALTMSSRCQLRSVADGREVLGRTVEQSDSLKIELGEELWLRGDNASAVQFSINGQAGRLLGVPSEVLSVRIGRDDYEDFLVRY